MDARNPWEADEKRLAEQAARLDAEAAEKREAAEPAVHLANDDGTRRAVSAVLIELAQGTELFADAQGTGYACFQLSAHAEVWPIRSKTFRQWLDSRYYELSKKGANRNSMNEALDTLEAKARYGGKRREVFMRVAGDSQRILIDLCNDTWQAVEVTAEGWKIMRPDMAFVRRSNLRALPTPERGGSLAELRDCINADAASSLLVIAWVLAALRPRGPYPILVFQGEQGTGKSTLARHLRSVIDPSAVPLRAMPKDERDLQVGAVNNFVLCFDNLSGLQPWQSDCLCRLSTGGGLATRTLYTDADESAFNLTRPVILNGIDDIATRPDLADRAIIVTLAPLTGKHSTEAELAEDWGKAEPRIFGALLDALSLALKNLPTTRLTKAPRMADFATFGVAALGKEFLTAYQGNQATLIEESLETSPVARAIRALVKTQKEWNGSPAGLLCELSNRASEAERMGRAWPKSARALRNQLRRLAPHLRHAGIEVEQGGGGRAGRDYHIGPCATVGKQAFQVFQAFPTVEINSLPDQQSVPESREAFQSVPENPANPPPGTDGTLGTDKSVLLHAGDTPPRRTVRI